MNTQQTNPSALPAASNPFAAARAPHVNAGTVDIEQSRAVAEAQGKLLIAKRFPRDAAAAFDKVMSSCSRPTLAAQATYSYPRAGETISGPSIRLAEELARAWGNIDFGIRELSQRDGVSEMQAYAWDLETNVMSSQNFTVKHERHTKQGVKRLVDPRDIYELTANQAGRRLRARILAILPPDLVEGALDRCRATLVGAANPKDTSKVAGLLKAFARYGVTQQHIEARLGHKIEAITAEELADLINIGNSLKDNMSSPAEWFEVHAADNGAASSLNATIAQQATAPATPAPVEKARRRTQQSQVEEKAQLEPGSAVAAETSPTQGDDDLV